MIHKNCGGKVIQEGDTYRCQKCKRGYKCVGQEHYLEGIVEQIGLVERNSQFGTIWIRKEGKETKIKKNELYLFVTEGWERGRIHPPVAQFGRRRLSQE
jgi:hypothetical protein